MGYTKLKRIEGIVSTSVPYLISKHKIEIPEKTKALLGSCLTPGAESCVWIEVSIDEQVLYLWEGNKVKSAYLISSGKRRMDTRKGSYKMYSLYKSYPMWGKDWWCPDVPYAMFFHHEFAIHAAYWHNYFGTPASHGCVNMTEMDAKEVYEQVKKWTVVWVH